MQAVDPVLATQLEPCGQGWQNDMPGVAVIVPVGQAIGGNSEKGHIWPAGQIVQVVLDVTVYPGGHFITPTIVLRPVLQA